jgi:hypothetical protein
MNGIHTIVFPKDRLCQGIVSMPASWEVITETVSALSYELYYELSEKL